MSTKNNKCCFVISPIGSPSSDIKKYSDKFLKFIVKYSLEPIGYEVVRSDEISEPGTITVQIIRKLIEVEIVVADLTSINPNVMYELAIRHALKKPVILMARTGEKLPFDIINERMIFFDINDIESIENARNELKRQAIFIESEQFAMDNLFSLTEEVVSQISHGSPIEKNIGIILEDIAYIKSAIRSFSYEKALMEEFESKTIKDKISKEKWIKILVEYPAYEDISSLSLEISSEQDVFDVLSFIWSSLRKQEDSTFRPPAYTYLWDWILIRKKDRVPLIIRGIMHNILATTIFRNGEIWRVEKLEEPLLNKPERFDLKRGSLRHL